MISKFDPNGNPIRPKSRLHHTTTQQKKFVSPHISKKANTKNLILDQITHNYYNYRIVLVCIMGI